MNRSFSKEKNKQMKKFLSTIILAMAVLALQAADGEYAVSKIPADLLKDAHVVKRFEDIRFELISLGKSREYKKIALTILNEAGDDYATMYEVYDKLRSVEA